jgi:hypothetical protein
MMMMSPSSRQTQLFLLVAIENKTIENMKELRGSCRRLNLKLFYVLKPIQLSYVLCIAIEYSANVHLEPFKSHKKNIELNGEVNKKIYPRLQIFHSHFAVTSDDHDDKFLSRLTIARS